MELISMTDFVLDVCKTHTGNNKIASILLEDYAKFLKQPLELRMFVPCDKDGNVLEEPKEWKDYLEYPESFDGNMEWYDLYRYQEAKDNVLFEGFEYVSKWYQTHLIAKNKISGLGQFQLDNFKTIEDMICIVDLELTQTAINQIGL